MIKNSILTAIKNIELEHKCTVLFACESGSRAWGFASPDSDYDIRFIYVNTLDWYLKLEDKVDTINKMLPDDLDLCGWDLQKTLRLFAKCNLGLNEWLNSPCIYYQDQNFYRQLKTLAPKYFNPKKAMHHYLSTANKMVENYLGMNPVNIKKIFYVLRPLLACMWIMHKKTMPPTVFQELLDQQELPSDIRKFITSLLLEKSTASEKHNIDLPAEILAWIHEQKIVFANETSNIRANTTIEWYPLNKILLEMTGCK